MRTVDQRAKRMNRRIGRSMRGLHLESRRYADVAEVFEGPEGPTFILPSPGARPAMRVHVPGGFKEGDGQGKGEQVIIPKETREAMRAAEVIEAAKAGRFGFAILKADAS